jgi:hypothetical protein
VGRDCTLLSRRYSRAVKEEITPGEGALGVMIIPLFSGRDTRIARGDREDPCYLRGVWTWLHLHKSRSSDEPLWSGPGAYISDTSSLDRRSISFTSAGKHSPDQPSKIYIGPGFDKASRQGGQACEWWMIHLRVRETRVGGITGGFDPSSALRQIPCVDRVGSLGQLGCLTLDACAGRGTVTPRVRPSIWGRCPRLIRR